MKSYGNYIGDPKNIQKAANRGYNGEKCKEKYFANSCLSVRNGSPNYFQKILNYLASKF